MALSKLTIPPSQSGYGVHFGATTVGIKLDGGRSRIRRDVVNNINEVRCTWTLTRELYTSFMTFYNTTIVYGSLPFLIDLLINSSTLTEYEAQFVPDTLELTEQAGHMYVLSATLEAIPTVA